VLVVREEIDPGERAVRKRAPGVGAARIVIDRHGGAVFRQRITDGHIGGVALVPAHRNELVDRVTLGAGAAEGAGRGVGIAAAELQGIVGHNRQAAGDVLILELQPARIGIVLVTVEAVADLVVGRDDPGAEQIIDIAVKERHLEAHVGHQLLPEPHLVLDGLLRLYLRIAHGGRIVPGRNQPRIVVIHRIERGHLHEMAVAEAQQGGLAKLVGDAQTRTDLVFGIGLDLPAHLFRIFRETELVGGIAPLRGIGDPGVKVIKTQPEVDHHLVELHLVLEIGAELNRFHPVIGVIKG